MRHTVASHADSVTNGASASGSFIYSEGSPGPHDSIGRVPSRSDSWFGRLHSRHRDSLEGGSGSLAVADLKAATGLTWAASGAGSLHGMTPSNAMSPMRSIESSASKGSGFYGGAASMRENATARSGPQLSTPNPSTNGSGAGELARHITLFEGEGLTINSAIDCVTCKSCCPTCTALAA